jgi:hypothetical protein
MSYTLFGPFANGGPPGIQYTFLNNVETYLKQISDAIDPNPATSVLNGSTSGTATLYQFMRGTYKACLVILSGFRNGSAPAQTIAVPVSFTTFFTFYGGGIPPVQFLLSGTPQSIGVVTTLASTGGSIAVVTTLNQYSFGDNGSGCDTLSFTGSQPSAKSAILHFEGV